MTSNGRIKSLQLLRGIAFICVFLQHSGNMIFDGLGAYAVSLFITLSGFLVSYHSNWNSSDEIFHFDILSSWKKIRRLYPLHIVTMIAALIYEILTDVIVGGEQIRVSFLGTIFLNVCLMQSWIPIKLPIVGSVYYSFNGVSWYLSTMLFVYALFPLIKHMILKSGDLWKLLLFTIWTEILFSIFGMLFFGTSGTLLKWFTYVFPPMRVFDFAYGCIVYRIISVNKVKSSFKSQKAYFGLGGGIIASIISIILFQKFDGVFLTLKYSMNFILASLLLVPSCYVLDEVKILGDENLFVKLGDISAFAFLIHQIVYKYFESANSFLELHISHIIITFMCFAVTIIMSYVYSRINKFIEDTKPLFS